MAAARSTSSTRAPRRAAARKPVRPHGVAAIALGAGIRWDRVGRVALLIVLFGIVTLYVGPLRSYISTWRESNARHAEVAKLKRENSQLRARRSALRDPQTLEREARRLGMVQPGERAYVVKNLPKGP